MVDARCVELWDRYIIINKIDDYEGKVVNIEEGFDILPYRLYFCL